MGVPGALQVANLSKLDEKDVISYLKAQGKMRIGIDMYVLLHWAFGRHKEYHEDLVENPDYKCDLVYEDIKNFLIDFVKEDFKLWLVYDGRTAPFKLAEQDRTEKREKAKQEKELRKAAHDVRMAIKNFYTINKNDEIAKLYDDMTDEEMIISLRFADDLTGWVSALI